MRSIGITLGMASRIGALGRVRKIVIAGGIALAGLLPLGATAVGESPAAATTTSPTISFVGHGWGHGRGAGQWGTLGYAISGGWSANQILAHYYSNTQFSSVANGPIRVILTANSGSDIIVTSSSPFSIAGVSFGANAQARMHRNADGSWEIDVSSNTTGCSTSPTWVSQGNVAESAAVASPNTSAYSTESYANALALCIGSTPYYYRGQIAAADYQGSPRTLNVVDTEDYLRGVVASESPAYWGTLGSIVATNSSAGNQPAGFFSLMAQAVEARSYALSSMGEFGFADICDSPYCQVYRGMQGENPISDLAISATAGEVLTLNGKVARTEFSSSTGGYTAGGTFPAVVDTYDSICVTYACNTHHSWSNSLTVAQLQSDFPSVGTLQGLTVIQRNGYGDFGGRVMSISVIGSSGSVSMSGEQFAWDTGLLSDWFTFSGSGITLTPNAAAASTVGGYYVDTTTGAIAALGSAVPYGSMQGVSLNKPVVGMAATPDGKGYWLVASDGGIFTFGDASFYGSMPGVGDTGTAVSMAPSVGVDGYYILTAQGNVYAFGQAPVVSGYNSAISGLSGTVIGIAAIPTPGAGSTTTTAS